MIRKPRAWGVRAEHVKSDVATVCALAHSTAVNTHPFQGRPVATEAARCVFTGDISELLGSAVHGR